MEPYNKILTHTKITPEIALKMRVDQFQTVKCPQCKHKYMLGELKPAMHLELINTGKFRPPDAGGNGWNYRCPNCKVLIYAPRW